MRWKRYTRSVQEGWTPVRTVDCSGTDSAMEIAFANNKLQRLFESQRALQREHGQGCARKTMGRLRDLEAAPCLQDMRTLPGNCHELDADRAGQLAIEVGGGKRLILEPVDNPTPKKPDGGLDWAAVKAVRILALLDYHA